MSARNWTVLPLREVTSLITKGTTPTTLGYSFVQTGVNFIKAESIDEDGRLRQDRLAYIEDRTHQVLARSQLCEDDILFSIAGVIGRTCLVRQSDLPANTNQALAIVRPDPKFIDPRFLFYTLRSRPFQVHSLGHVVQTAQANVSLGVLAAAPVPVPPLLEQRRIAAILAAYDDLIENCERRIRVLDEMARALYREWFVHFRYPGHEKVELVDSELGRIPKGWRAATIRDASSFLSRGIAPRYADDGSSIVINQKCIRDGRLSLSPARRQNRPIPEERRIRKGDVLINSTGVGTLGRVAQVLDDIEDCTVDTHVTIVRSDIINDSSFLGIALLELQSTFERMGVGATGQTELNRTAISEVPLVLPSADCQREFANHVQPMRDASLILQKRIENLRQTRDLLLPRLLSGQLSVENAA